MKTANIHEAKSQLSQLIKLALAGEEVLICRAGKPVVSLTPVTKVTEKRKAGSMKGKIKIQEDFDQLPGEFTKFFSKDKS
jgi:prevent-host-death family protein